MSLGLDMHKPRKMDRSGYSTQNLYVQPPTRPALASPDDKNNLTPRGRSRGPIVDGPMMQLNFDLPLLDTFPPGIQGCYLGQPVNFFCNYDDAVAHKNHLRDVEPGLYLARRLLEAPVPDVNQNVNNIGAVEEGTQESVSGNENDNPIEPVSPTDANEPLNGNVIQSNLDDGNEVIEQNENNVVASNSIDDNLVIPHDESNVAEPNSNDAEEEVSQNVNNVSSSSDTGVNDSNELVENQPNDDIEEKPELHLLNRSDVNGMNVLLAEELSDTDIDDSDGEIDFIIINGQFPQPVKYSSDGLVKRENDPISGDLAYDDKNGNRIYKIGTKLVELQKKLLDKMEEWSTPPYSQSERLDYRVVAALLLACVGGEKLATNEIEDEVMQFIYKIMEIRTKSCKRRCNAIPKYRDDVVTEWAKK